MKTEGNASNNSFEITTGVIDVTVVAINPTLKELNELGVQFKTEPEYLGVTDNGEKKVRLDFWVKPVIEGMGLTKHTFFLEDRYKLSSTNKYQYINAHCQSTWAENEGAITADWFKLEGVRKARVGEVELMEFLRNFASVQKIEFDDITRLFNGNYSELRDLIKTCKNKVQLLFIENKGYQSTYTRFSMRGGNTRMDYWQKHLDKQSPNINYQGTLKIKVWANQEPETSSESAPPPLFA
jgi:hypothetical protein